MRVLFLTALLASVATPAMAAPRDGGHHFERADRSDRDSNRAERADRPQRAERADRPQRAEREAPPVRQVQQTARVVPSGDSVANWHRGDRDASRAAQTDRARTDRAQEWAARSRDARVDSRADVRVGHDYARPGTTDRTRRVRIDTRPRVQTEQRRDGDRTQWGSRDHDRTQWGSRDRNHTQWTSRDRDRWRGQWRNDHRYDWRNYRNQHRSIFRLSAYFDPFGYNNYRRFDIGFRLQPNYYSSRYWISNPYMYRLPYAPPGYQWIRYYDDAILIETWSGQVADVLYNFFW